MKRKLNRRTFLRSAGVAIALPTLDAMAPVRTALAKGVFADEKTMPQQRMVMICTSLGLHGPSLFPETAGRDYKNTPYLEYLKDHRDDYTVFSGLSHPDQSGADGHSSELTWLTSARHPGLGGFRNTISVDQYVREKLGYVTRFPSIALSTSGQNSQSFTGGGVMVPAEYRPSAMFEQLFLEGKPYQIERQKRQLGDGKSILDSIGVQARQLHKRVSSAAFKPGSCINESVRPIGNGWKSISLPCVRRNNIFKNPNNGLIGPNPSSMRSSLRILRKTAISLDGRN